MRCSARFHSGRVRMMVIKCDGNSEEQTPVPLVELNDLRPRLVPGHPVARGIMSPEAPLSRVEALRRCLAEGVTRYQPTTDKIMRLHAQTAMIENGFVQIPEDAPWLAEYLHELTMFPKGKHDDQADLPRSFWTGSGCPCRAGDLRIDPPASSRSSRSAANRHPSRPYGPPAAWSGPPSRRKRGQPRRLTPCLVPRWMSSDTARQSRSSRYNRRRNWLRRWARAPAPGARW